MLQGSRERRKEDSLINMQECQTARACPSHHWILLCGDRDTEPQNKAGFPPLTFKKMSKKPAAYSQLLCAIPVMWAAKADCRLLTVVAIAIFKIAICNWLINAAWVQTVMLIKLRGNFRKQYWWVLQGARRGWTWLLSPPDTVKTNKQVKYRPEQNGS